MPGTVPVFVNVIWDPTMGYNTHTLWDPALTATPPPGVPKPSTPTYAIEMIATQLWTVGYLMGKNKFAPTVLHMGAPICIADHDLGPLIPDLTVPPANLYYVIMWPFSGRQMATTASTVQMTGQPTSCSQLFGLPPIPMLTCGDPLTLPLSFPIINCVHTLTVGATAGDLLLGVFKAVMTAAIDAFFEWGVPGLGKLIFGKAAEGVGRTLGREILQQALGKAGLTGSSFAKAVVNGLAGYAQGLLSGDPNASVTIGVLGGVGGVQIGGDPNDPNRFWGTTVGGVPVSGVHTPAGDPLHIFS